MLKPRLIASLPLLNGVVVQSIGFARYLPVGRPEIAVEYLDRWGIDEIVMLDIRATLEGREPNYALVERVAKKCFVPLSVGGGVRSLVHAKQLLQSGADKIVVNSAVHANPKLIGTLADHLGTQCVIASLDVRQTADNSYSAFSHSGENCYSENPLSLALELERLGAGEVLLRSIDRDGSKQGFDLSLLRLFSKQLSIPVVASGGVGHPKHFFEGIQQGKASAVAAGNFFHFTEHSAILAKAWLQRSLDVRLDTYASYDYAKFQESGRLGKRSDETLANLRFRHYEKEVI